MNKKTIAIILGIGVVGLVGSIIFILYKPNNKLKQSPTGQNLPNPVINQELSKVAVNYTDSGFSVQTINTRKNKAVEIQNNSGKLLQIISDGSNFDIEPGSTHILKFEKSGMNKYVNKDKKDQVLLIVIE